jgi:hypothetical protein
LVLERSLAAVSRCFFLRIRADFVRYCCDANPTYIDPADQAAADAYQRALDEANTPDVVARARSDYEQAVAVGEESMGSAYVGAVLNYAVFLRGPGGSAADAILVAEAALQKHLEAEERGGVAGAGQDEAEAVLTLAARLQESVNKWKTEESQ